MDDLSNIWRDFPHLLAAKLSKFKWYPYNHLRFISLKVLESIGTGNGRLIVSAPPRHGKSEFISHWLPVWFLERFPEKNVILTSYEADVAAQWGRKVRNEFESQPELTTKLAEDSTAANRFNTRGGGGMVTAGAGGPITGKGGQLIIIDDPIKNFQDAESPLKRRALREWFDWVLYTRAEPGATIILLMTRWNEDDLSGYLLKQHTDKWTEIRLPAIAEENDLLSRKIGQPLCEERYDTRQLEQIKNAIGSRAWLSLYQQRPTAQEGGLVKRNWIKFWKELPSRKEMKIQSWDMTFKETQEGSYVVGQYWIRSGADKYLVDQVRARMDFSATLSAFRTFNAKHPECSKRLVEDKANGPAIISALRKEIAGIVPVETDGSKYARFESISPQFESGNIYLPDPSIAPWVNDYIEELVSFPNAQNDDQVDATSQAVRELSKHSDVFTEDLIPRSIKSIDSIQLVGEKDSW